MIGASSSVTARPAVRPAPTDCACLTGDEPDHLRFAGAERRAQADFRRAAPLQETQQTVEPDRGEAGG